MRGAWIDHNLMLHASFIQLLIEGMRHLYLSQIQALTPRNFWDYFVSATISSYHNNLISSERCNRSSRRTQNSLLPPMTHCAN